MQRVCKLLRYLLSFNLNSSIQNNKTVTASSATVHYPDIPVQTPLAFSWGIISDQEGKLYCICSLLRAFQTSHVDIFLCKCHLKGLLQIRSFCSWLRHTHRHWPLGCISSGSICLCSSCHPQLRHPQPLPLKVLYFKDYMQWLENSFVLYLNLCKKDNGCI